jgi:hypothetical protein
LRQRGIRNVALVLIELAGSKKAARRHQRLVQLVDDGGLADAGIAGDQHQHRAAAGDDVVEGGEQSFDLPLSPIQFLGNQKPVGRVSLAQREGVDRLLRVPRDKAAPEVALQAGRSLVALFGSLGEQLRHDGGDGYRQVLQPLYGRDGLSGNMAVHPFHRVRGHKGQGTGEHFVQGDPERIEIAPGIDRTVHTPGLFGRHVGERPGDELGRFR